MKKFIYYSTLFSICTESFSYHLIIDLKLFYLIIFLNTILITFLNKKIFLNKWLIFFYIYLLLTGILSITFKSNSVNTFSAQFVGIFFVSLYFYNYFKTFENYYDKIINDYVRLCVIIIIIGLPFYIYSILTGNISGFHSILIEPAHFATFVLPAFFYSYKNLNFPRYYYKLILFSVFASASSLAIIGLAFAIFLSPLRIKIFRIIFSFILIGILFTSLYFFYGNFNQRVSDTASGIQSNDLSGVNLSTYAFVSNLFITEKSLSNNLILGSGLGSHEITHNKYLSNISGIEEFADFNNLNSKDANSLLLRVLSDLGVLGLFFIIIFLYKNYYTGNLNHKTYLSRAILIYFLCKLIREGHYFPPEFYFFIFSFIFLNKKLLFNKNTNHKLINSIS